MSTVNVWRSVGFFLQAEDGIRDKLVTGVQTCALPIWRRASRRAPCGPGRRSGRGPPSGGTCACRRRPSPSRRRSSHRSEEGRVGKERRYRGSPYHEIKYCVDETEHDPRSTSTMRYLII